MFGQLFSKKSKQFDHHTQTSLSQTETDGRTEGDFPNRALQNIARKNRYHQIKKGRSLLSMFERSLTSCETAFKDIVITINLHITI